MSVPVNAADAIKLSIKILQDISNDIHVPKNIRRAVLDAIEFLQDNSVSPGVRAANALSVLDEISQDPNMPTRTRVQFWNVASMLEKVKDRRRLIEGLRFTRYNALKCLSRRRGDQILFFFYVYRSALLPSG